MDPDANRHRGWSPDAGQEGHLHDDLAAHDRTVQVRQGQGSLLDDDTVVWAPTPSIPLPVRERDPDTSIIAAKATTRAKRSRLRADILRVHQAHPAGLTDDELDVMLVDDDRGTIARRRKDLVVEGLVEDSGQRRATRRGSQAIVFRLVVDR